MENSIYNSMISATQLLEKQAVISNNLANISTTGFKETFNYILDNENKNINDLYNKNIKEYYNLSPGMLSYTERNLDLVVKDHGWLAVKDLNGREAYTKNGHVKINSDGKLTIQNYIALGDNDNNIKIHNDINIKILSNGLIAEMQKNNNVIKSIIGSLKLVRLPEQDLIKKENGLFYLNQNIKLNKYNNKIPYDNNIRIQSGMLETSNVNPSKNMIDMISNARQFEMQMQMISICDKNIEYANQLLNINN